MSVKIKSQGEYELFETTKQHRILVLDGKQWYAAVAGQQGDILVRSNSDHEKDRTLQQGHYYLADFNNDPKFKDMPHLFLEKSSRFQELVLPNGLPTSKDHQKKVVWTNDTIKKSDLEKHLQGDGKAGSSKAGSSKAKGARLPIDNYDELTVDEVKKKLGSLSTSERQRIRQYEEEHKGRKTLLSALDDAK
jgi:hypothetical protein